MAKSAKEIAQQILSEDSSSLLAGNVKIKNSKGDTQDDVDTETEQTQDGSEQGSGDAEARLNSSVSSGENETRDDNELENDSEVNPEGDDPYFTANNFDDGGPSGGKSITTDKLTEENDDGDETDGDDDEEDEEDMGDDEGDDEDSEESLEEHINTIIDSEKYQASISEHTDALFSGKNALSEEYRSRATTIFESAVRERSVAVAKYLEEQYDRKLSMIREKVEREYQQEYDNLVEHINNYLDYVVSEWTTENQLPIENGLRTEITEQFIDGLKTLFIENYIDVPEDKFDVLGELQSDLEERNTELNSTLNKLSEANAETKKLRRELVLRNLEEDLVLTDREKLRSLSESVNYENDKQFERKVKTLKESYFNKDTKVSSDKDEDTVRTLQESAEELNSSTKSNKFDDPEVANISSFISSRFGNSFKVNREISKK